MQKCISLLIRDLKFCIVLAVCLNYTIADLHTLYGEIENIINLFYIVDQNSKWIKFSCTFHVVFMYNLLK